MLNPGQTTLGNIRATVRQQADIVNSQFITDAELNGWISSSYYELYNLLVQKYGNDYFVVNTYQFTTDGVNELFSLPDGSSSYTLADGVTTAPAFFKGLGVELWISSVQTTPPQWITLHRFNFGERNAFSLPVSIAPYGYIALKYRYNGNQLWFRPLPQAGQLIQLRYVPRAMTLSDAGTITLNTVVPGNSVTINGDSFSCVSSGAAGTQFNVGGTDTITAVNLSAAITISFPGYVAATSSVNIVTLAVAAGTIVWSTGSSTMTLAVPSVAAGVPSTWTSLIDGISGFEEYVTVDATIKALQKEESDTSVQLGRKAFLLQSIEAASANRDPGEPFTSVDTGWDNQGAQRGQFGQSGGW